MRMGSRIFREMDGNQKKIQFSSAPSMQVGLRGDPKAKFPFRRELPEEPECVQECVLARSGYRVRLADSPGQRSSASILINSMYSWRGYTTDGIDLSHHNPNRITLEASTEQHLFGTLTLGLDSDDGLLADGLYQREIDSLRSMGRRVCEISKLAFNPQYSSKEALASLFHLAYIYAHNIHNATDVVIEVNPRHAGFYKRRLGFNQIGDTRNCPRVDAPAVLLRGNLDYGAEQISRHAGSRDISEKSLYPYFFSEIEVQGLTNRIRRAS